MIADRAEPDFRPELAESLWTDRLKKGIWPRSNVLWFSVFYLSLFIIRPWEILVPELGDYRFERVIGLLAVALVATTRKWEWRGGLQSATAVLFFATVWLSGQLAYLPAKSEPDLIEFITILISFFVIIYVVRTRYQLLFVVTCYIVTMGVYVGKSEWEYFVNGGGQYAMGVKRLAGIDFTYGHPNALATSILCSLPFAYFLYTVREELTSTWPKFYRRLFPWCLRAYGVIAVQGVFLTRSRAGSVGFVALVLLIALNHGSWAIKMRRALCCVVVLFGVFLFLPTDMRERIQTLWDPTLETRGAHKGAHNSAVGRYYGFLAGLEMLERRPLLGVGIGNFKYYRVDKVDGVYLSAHNLVGEILGEVGILGTGSFVMLLWVLAMNMRKTHRDLRGVSHPHAPMLSGLQVACRNSLLLLFLQGFSGHTLQRFNWFWLAAFSWLAAQCAAELKNQRQVEEFTDARADVWEPELEPV